MKTTQSEYESTVVVGAHGVAAEEDHVVVWKVVGVGLASIVIFALSGIWAWRILVGAETEFNPEGPAPTPAAVGQYEIGIVNQRLFDLDGHATKKLASQHAALDHGWGETPGTKVHPTIGEAMDQVVQGTPKATAP